MPPPSPQAVFNRDFRFLLGAILPFILVVAKFILWSGYDTFDFYTFHLAGILANNGQVDILYQPESFMRFFEPTYGKPGLLPWFYPPVLIPYCQFLALFPVATAYLVNGGLSIVVYLAVVIRVFPDRYKDIIFLSALPMIIMLGFGHPSILLLAFIFLGYHFAKHSLWKGLLALTFSAAKPHMGGVVLMFLFFRQPRQALIPSLLIFVSFVGGGAWLYGADIWMAFFHGIGAAAAFLGTGIINQQWISSVYAGFIILGAPVWVAMAAHAIALLGMAMAMFYAFRSAHSTRFWAVSGVVLVFASPYLMYYDIIYLLFAMALVVNTLDIQAARHWIYLLFMLEFGFLSVLNFETTSGFGALAFLIFAAMLVVGRIRYADLDRG
jgi:hypothetical protein